MTIKEAMLKQKGIWKIDNFWIIDLDKELCDDIKWYKATNSLEQELTKEKLEEILKECKTIERVI